MSELLERLQEAFPGGEFGVSADGIPFVRLPPERVPPAVADLRHRFGYERFVDLTAVDDPSRPDRFELQYLFYSLQARQWIRIKARTADEAPSITAIWPGANFYEREVFDLFGVRFIGHPDLRRILLPDDWQGHPLRRDEPLGGEPVEFSHNVQDQHYGRDPRGAHGR